MPWISRWLRFRESYRSEQCLRIPDPVSGAISNISLSGNGNRTHDCSRRKDVSWIHKSAIAISAAINVYIEDTKTELVRPQVHYLHCSHSSHRTAHKSLIEHALACSWQPSNRCRLTWPQPTGSSGPPGFGPIRPRCDSRRHARSQQTEEP
jgi:hypothetical protein